MGYKYLLQIMVFVLGLPLLGWAQNVEVKNDFFYIDGQKFFVKGIGYEVVATPGQLPWEHTFNADLMHSDIQRMVYQQQISNGYLLDTLEFAVQDMSDATLVFNCYDASSELIKSEEKNILIADVEVTLPTIEISIANSEFWQDGYVEVNFTAQHFIGSNVCVFTIGAAFDVTYNSFKKRIVSQLTMSRINDLLNSMDRELIETSAIRIFPNPAQEYFTVTYDGPLAETGFRYAIFNDHGVNVKESKGGGWTQPIDISALGPGLYFVEFTPDGRPVSFIRKLVKF